MRQKRHKQARASTLKEDLLLSIPENLSWDGCLLWHTLRSDVVHTGFYDSANVRAVTLCGKALKPPIISQKFRITCEECQQEYEKRFPNKWPKIIKT